jgi:hypothetical protein
MDEIIKQVSNAKRRINLQRFLSTLIRCLMIVLLVSLVAIIIPKILVIGFLTDAQGAAVWNWSWLGGSALVALVLALAITLWNRATSVETAIEVDREFGLRERVSSALALPSDERESEFGRALLEDAARRVEPLDMNEHFKIRLDWRALVPVLLAMCAFGIAFGLRNAVSENLQASQLTPAEQKRIDQAEEAMRKKLEQQLKKSSDKALKKAELEFQELLAEKDKLDAKDPQSVKKMLSKLNDIKQELEKRQQEIGDSEQIKKQLSNMKDLEKGVGDKIAKNMQTGSFDKAKQEVDKLAEKLANDSLTAEEKKELAEQMSKLADALNEVAEKNQQAQQELKDQIEQAKRDGNLDKAAEKQEQLESLQKQQRQMDQLKSMAQKLGKCSECMGEGKPSEQQMADAQQALQELSDQLSEMQQDAESMEAINQVMTQISECKGMLGGDGEMESDFDSLASGGSGQGDGQGDGMGEGQGFGERPEAESKTGFFDSKVKGQVQAGEAIITGKVDGENEAGESQLSVREKIQASLSEESDPLTDLRLPRSQKEQAKEYFEKIRTGE